MRKIHIYRQYNNGYAYGQGSVAYKNKVLLRIQSLYCDMQQYALFTHNISMPRLSENILFDCLRFVLRPLVTFCLNHGLKIQDLLEAVKELYVSMAAERIESTGQRVTESRLAVMTGVHRRDVTRLRSGETKDLNSRDLTFKVVGQWQNDKRFLTKGGKPCVLECNDQNSGFYKLVRSVSRELNPSTVLFELERTGAITRSGRGVTLVTDAFVPRGDIKAAFSILASDSADLISAVEENVFHMPAVSNLHCRTEYDRVRAENALDIKLWLLKEGHALHERARAFISQFDQDIAPKAAYRDYFCKVSITSFSNVSLKKGDGGLR